MNRARFCDLFKETLKKKPHYADKVADFVKRKVENPTEKYNAKDTPFISAGLYGKTNLGLRHAHFSQDDSILYRVHGKPAMIDIFGIFSHKELGTEILVTLRRKRGWRLSSRTRHLKTRSSNSNKERA